VPFACMLLADLGAGVIRVDRADGVRPYAQWHSVLDRGRRSIALDLKNRQGVRTALRLAQRCDVLVEGFRPGVAERLGIGPRQCHARNPALVYARMTGWGQRGPLAQAPGHDINYIALTGALDAIGSAGGPPVPPVNLLGDFAGGGMLLFGGILAAVLDQRRTGRGRVVDTAVVDGTALLMSMVLGMSGAGQWHPARGGNLLDGGAPFYGARTGGTSRSGPWRTGSTRRWSRASGWTRPGCPTGGGARSGRRCGRCSRSGSHGGPGTAGRRPSRARTPV
jgi:alpha-methylacyl-CoA racemase